METLEESQALSTNDIWGGRKLIADLQLKASGVLDPLIVNQSSVAVLDYPSNTNVGDSLIWLGEMAYLRKRNLSPCYVCDYGNYDFKKLRNSLKSDPVILMHGGGNFGTLWPKLHSFRLKVIRDFPDAAIIQLPQSIHFQSEDNFKETAETIGKHPNYTLLVRDQPSFELAKKHFDCKVILCPDMAFFIGPIALKQQPTYDRFILSRTDHEKSNDWLNDLSKLNAGVSIDQSDWLKQCITEKVLYRIEMHTLSLRNIIDANNLLLSKLWMKLAEVRGARGQELLERGRVIISDRLHVHILSILLNKPHVLIDNSYQKLGNFHKAWTQSYQGVKFVSTLEEALAVASDFDKQLSNSQSH